MSPDIGPRLPDDHQVLLALLQQLDERPCLPSHLLEGFVADTLTTREAEHVHAHLRQCVVCTAALARLQSMHADEPAPPVAARQSPEPRPVLFLAAGLIGRSPAFTALENQIDRLLRGSSGRALPALLIEGEAGTGKSMLARAVHAAGARRGGPFVAMNSAATPDELAESELFGYERGAFSGAREAKAGLFQQAYRGTLFLDEIALMPVGLQPKLLRALEDRAVCRLGGTRSEPADVWIIAASSADLSAAVRQRLFREDLYHRLAAVTLRLPPLRERGEDVLLLAEHFLERACREYGLPPKRLDSSAYGALLAHSWPGNVRELASLIERVTLFAGGEVVTAEDLEIDLPPRRRPADVVASTPVFQAFEAVESRPPDLSDVEHLAAAFREEGGNISRLAVRLGISRNTLRYRLEKLGLLRKKKNPGQ